jgi:energy-coupling factor transporter transmembrane protein EcfT
MRRFNWALWGGLLLAVLAFFSYFFFFAQFPLTRDVPWVSFLLLLIAAVLLVTGWRRAPRKILASIVTVLGFFVIGAFTFMVTAGSKNLPLSNRAPAVGQRAPAFALPDTQNRTVSLADALNGSNGVLLVFYRGYW